MKRILQRRIVNALGWACWFFDHSFWWHGPWKDGHPLGCGGKFALVSISDVLDYRWRTGEYYEPDDIIAYVPTWPWRQT